MIQFPTHYLYEFFLIADAYANGASEDKIIRTGVLTKIDILKADFC